MGFVNCPECNHSPVSDQATACPKCGYPIKKAEYMFCNVNGLTGFGGTQLRQLLREGWQVVDKHEEMEEGADGQFLLIVYKLMR